MLNALENFWKICNYFRHVFLQSVAQKNLREISLGVSAVVAIMLAIATPSPTYFQNEEEYLRKHNN